MQQPLAFAKMLDEGLTFLKETHSTGNSEISSCSPFLFALGLADFQNVQASN